MKSGWIKTIKKIFYRWTWYDYTYECHLYENCNLNTNVTDNCSCYTSERCDSNEETTPALVGGISTKVEVLLGIRF